MNWHYVRECIELLSPEDRRRWLRLVPLVVLTSATEVVGAMGIFALVAVIAEPASLSRLPLLGRLAPADLDSQRLAVLLAIAVFCFYLVKSALFAVTEYAQASASARTAANLSVRMLTAYLRAPYLFHAGRNSADLVHSTQRVAGELFGTVISSMVHVLTEVLVFLSIVAVLLFAAPFVTAAAVAALLALGGLLVVAMRRRSSRLGEATDALSSASMRQQVQALGAIEEIIVLGRADSFARRFKAISDDLAQVNAERQFFATLPRITVETLFICGALGVTIALILLGASSTRTISLLGLFAYAGFRVIPSANRILFHVHTLRHGKAGVDRLRRDLRDVERMERAHVPSTGAPLFDERIEVRDVSFAYLGQESPVLAGIDLAVPLGQSIAIVGPTGSGKSSLIRLLVGLLEPDHGEIRVGGEPLASCLDAWRARLGYVPQEVHLVDDSLRRNVAFGLADDEIDESMLHGALRRARLDDLVRSLPEGVDTRVGDRGVRLSGGERQRVGIARALYHRPRVLVLDEATSSLDPRTEAEILGQLRTDREGAPGETLIAVTHRLNSVRGFDRIAFLLDGRLRAAGTFDELSRDVEEFRQMALLDRPTTT